MPSNSSWYAKGLRWIGSLFNAAADGPEPAATAAGQLSEFLPYEEFISDVRYRIQNRYY